MLHLGVFILIPTAIFAETGNYGQQRTSTPSNLPMDYNNDTEISPNTNIIFNFEQIRRDQPPNVEMREENIGRYMNHPMTTIEPTEDKLPDKNTNRNEALTQLQNVPPPRNNQQWDPTAVQTSTLLPASLPPAPKFVDYPEHFNNPAISHLNSYDSNPVQSMPAITNNQISQEQPNPFAIMPNQEQLLRDFVRNYVHPEISNVMPSRIVSTTSIPLKPEMQQTSTLLPASLASASKFNDFPELFNNSAISNLNSYDSNPVQSIPTETNNQMSQEQPNPFATMPNQEQLLQDFVRNFVHSEISSVMPSRIVSTTSIPLKPQMQQIFVQNSAKESRKQQPTINRGIRKFSWNDLTTPLPTVNPTFQQPTSTVLGFNRGPPPSVPTLSPWIDGLGK